MLVVNKDFKDKVKRVINMYFNALEGRSIIHQAEEASDGMFDITRVPGSFTSVEVIRDVVIDMLEATPDKRTYKEVLELAYSITKPLKGRVPVYNQTDLDKLLLFMTNTIKSLP